MQLEDRKLHIKARGLLYRVTLWETPILATVSELFSREMGKYPDRKYMESAAIDKAMRKKEKNNSFSLFGMRRRFSFEVEDRVTELLKLHAGESLYGTSNVYMAYRHNPYYV